MGEFPADGGGGGADEGRPIDDDVEDLLDCLLEGDK